MDEKILQLDKEIVSEIILKKRCYRKLKQLCEFGTRFAGTPGEQMAREFIVQEFKSYGLDPKVETFEHLGWRRKTASLQIIEPVDRKVQTISLAGAPSTDPGGIEGVVLYVGNGTPAEFNRAKMDIKGKIVISTSLAPTAECMPPPAMPPPHKIWPRHRVWCQGVYFYEQSGRHAAADRIDPAEPKR
jgi:hypothetical protein